MGGDVGLTVACVLRSGGAYRAEHVGGLARQVAHFLPDARFVCLSDVPVPCERIEIASDWPGWWAKIELFEHFKGRTLYLDIDSVIAKDPAPLVTGRFTMIENWMHPGRFCSGVMSWDGDYSRITEAFRADAPRVMADYVTTERWGDQAFIAEHASPAAFPAGSVASFRYQQLSHSEPPKHAKIVAFNATHLPWNSRAKWARKWW
jgi:hypothetical protein